MNKRWLKRGAAFLEGSPEAPKKSAKEIVSIFYESQGGEILRVDTALLTWSEADALESHLGHTTALAWLRKGRLRSPYGKRSSIGSDSA